MISKNKIKLLVIAVILCYVVATFTGCGFCSGSSLKDQERDGEIGNKLCYVEDTGTEEVISSQGVEFNGISVTKLERTNVTNLYGRNFQPTQQGFTMIRELALVAYGSVFGTAPEDDFADMEQFGTGINLDPGTVAQKVSDAVKGITSNDTVAGFAKGIAMSILIAVWCISFISQIINEKFTIETALKSMLQLLCSVMLVLAAPELANGFAEIIPPGEIGNIGNNFGDFQNSVDKALGDITGISIGLDIINIFELPLGTLWLDFGSIKALLLLALPLWGMLQCSYKVVSVLIMTRLELVARVSFAPIPIAFGAHNGFSHEEIRFFRGIMACALQPAFIAIGVSCAGDIVSAVVGAFVGDGAATGLMGSVLVFLVYMIISAYVSETKRLCHEVIAR